MDFFHAQDRARKRTKYLVFLFALAVIGTILAGYAATMVGLHYGARDERGYYEERAVTHWDPRIFGTVTLITVGIVGFASLFKWSQMRSGGSAVAEMVGGRLVTPQTTDLREKRLLNVVEEMAIASGVPVPAVYILDDEPALNAFAAGLTTSDAVVAVTRGTLEKLNRDELQGVVAHEFSHILNGDMRLNVKLTAIVFGILVIGLMGRGILQSLGRGRVRSSGKNKGGGIAVIIAIGLALLIIGYVGYFFGRLIQAAVSRQREFLADASAVQFTRNPGGVSGALKKIGGYALGSTVLNRHSGEIGHFFFAQAFRSNFGGLWATHPPLPERIKAVDPQWDGKLFEPETVVDVKSESFATAGFGGVRHSPVETLARVHAARADVPPPLPRARIAFTPASVMADIGTLTDSHFRHASRLMESLPTRLRDAAHDPQQAAALVYALLCGPARGGRDGNARDIVAKHAGAEAAAAVDHLRPAVSVLDPAGRLPLLQLALPSLRTLDAAALDRFVTTLDELVHADAQVSPFEFALQKMLVHQLKLGAAPSNRVQFHSFQPLAPDIAVVLSTLAIAGAPNNPTIAGKAFAAGARELPLIASSLVFLGAGAAGFEKADAALDRLAASALPIKQRVLHAAAHVIGADGTVTVEEGELYRAFAAAMDCPVPVLTG